MAVLETKGIPTVTAATTEFAYEASQQWQALGFRERSVVEVRHPFGHLEAGLVRAEAARLLPDVVRLLMESGNGASEGPDGQLDGQEGQRA